ncbi:MAG: winged helix DNA-binding domain-containing protein, partial [Candidatus Hodarchaeota archaeon]
MQILDLHHVNKLILKKQRLSEDSKIDDIVQITEDLCGLHSTDLKTSYLSLFARTNKFTKADLERELYEKKTLGRVRGMRRTLFIETANLIPIVYAATFNLIEKSFEKYMEFHKVALGEYQEISQNIMKILKERELSASEIRKELNSKSNIPAIIQLMCNHGLLIRGKPIKDWKDRRNKYALFKDYFPTLDLNKLNEKEAMQKIIEKYVKTYGPVTETDISWWTGLTKAKIKDTLKKIEKVVERIKINNIQKTYIILKEDLNNLVDNPFREKTSLILIPELDPYPMGYKDRERYIDSKNLNKLFDRSGNITSTIILDGIPIGVWDTEENPEPIVKFHLFHSIADQLLDGIYSKAEKIGQFIFDRNVNVKKCKKMTPLTERTAGGFMTPLKN